MRARGPAETTPVRLLLRHADAGVRALSGTADEWRGLSALGHVQAEDVVGRLRGLPLFRVLSSPSLRCRQTVVPLARELGVDVEPCRELAVDAGPGALLRFLGDPDTDAAVLCTHREALELLFTELALRGSAVPAIDPPMEKAAAWLVLGLVGDGSGARLHYLPARQPRSARRADPGPGAHQRADIPAVAGRQPEIAVRPAAGEAARQMSWRSWARRMASFRRETASLRRMPRTWVFTVLTDTNMVRAISSVDSSAAR